MKKIYKSFIIALLLNSNILAAEAKQSTNANPWGYTGLINMPTADVLSFGEFYVTGNYLFRNPGFTANAHMGIFDRLELGVVGGIPSAGFSGLAGNIKYQLIKPSSKSPTSLAMGLNLVGLARDTNLVTGNYLYMVLSHDFNWKMSDNSLYNLFSGHVGFGGNLDGSRIMAGIDIPVTDYVNLEGEYMGKVGNFNDMINFGVKVRPFSFLTASLLTIGTSSKGFANTEVLFSLSYNAKIPNFQTAKNEEEPSPKPPVKVVIKPTPEPTPFPTVMPTPEETPLPRPKATPIVTPTPEPEVSIKPEPTSVPTVVPTPVTVATPKATPKPEITIVSEFGTLRGQVKGSIGKDNPQKVNVTLKSIKGKFEKKEITNTEGDYLFKDVPKGEYTVTYEKEGYQEAKKQLLITAGDITEANIELTASNGSVSGRVIDIKGKPASELIVIVDKGKKTTTDKDGKYSFNNLTAGYHLLSVYKSTKEIKSLDLDIIAGTELTKEIVLDSEIKKEIVKAPDKVIIPKKENTTPNKVIQPTHTNSAITGKITDKSGDLKGARIMLEGDKLTVMTISGQDGSYSVKNLSLGSYKMTVSKSGYTTRIFSVKIKESKQAKLDVNLKPE